MRGGGVVVSGWEDRTVWRSGIAAVVDHGDDSPDCNACRGELAVLPVWERTREGNDLWLWT